MSDMQEGRRRIYREQSAGAGDVNRRKPQSQQQRQLLSCTKCRERKVKCDRTKPCSACCARGAPKDCKFIAEGGDYVPIQQSYELKKLRIENKKLKERLRARRISIDEENSDLALSPDSQGVDRLSSSQKKRAKQKRFYGHDWQDSIYFGSPGLASVIHDFASLNIDASVNLSHVAPRGASMYTPRNALPHAFATIFKATPEECIPQLLSCLPSRDELLGYLQIFESRGSSSSFPHAPVELTKDEVEHFLSDSRNAHLCPDMLALLFAVISLGAQYSTWNKAGGKWNADIIEAELRNGDVFIAAAMQALRLSSFMHKPSIRSIQTLILIGPYLTNSGRFLDAWTLFGTTIRSAHAIGLHRHTKLLDPAPPTQKECSIRQTLWWWMLHMDEQYSMTLGRPLGISGTGDCPWPHELTTDPTMLRFGEFVNHHTVLARSILSSEKLNNAKIDELSDALRTLLDTMPEILQFSPNWIRDEIEASDLSLRIMATVYYCRTHTYLVLLNRQRVDPSTIVPSPKVSTPSTPFRAANETFSSHPSPTSTANAPFRGRAAVLASSEALLNAFMFFHWKDPASLIDWTLGQQAFNSCMILLFDAIELRRITTAIAQVEHAYVIFKDLDDNGVHKLAGLAVERISWGLTELLKIGVQTHHSDITTQQPHHQDQQVSANMIKNEASLQREPHDTVMGDTGMILLEDPGLQAFHPEPFSPIRGDVSGINAKPTMAEGQWTTRALHTTDTASDGRFQHVRSTSNVQGTRRSPTARSAPTRYATPTEDYTRSFGSTAPTSPTSFGISRGLQHESPAEVAGPQADLQTPPDHQRMRPPHLLHTQALATARASQIREERHTTHQESLEGPVQHPSADAIPAYPHHNPYIQSRHNSCPTFAYSASDAPLLRPTYSSPSNLTTAAHPRPDARLPPSIASEHASFYTNFDITQGSSGDSATTRVQPSSLLSSSSSAARTALSVAGSTDFMLGYSSSPGLGYEGSVHTQDTRQQAPQSQQPITGYSMPAHFSEQTPSTMRNSSHHLYSDGRRAYFGASESGES